MNHFELLQAGEFELSGLDGIPLYWNKSDSSIQSLELCFVRDFSNPRSANKAQILMNVFSQAISKGTKALPTRDAHIRALRSAGLDDFGYDVARNDSKTIITLPMSLPNGAETGPAISRIFEIAEDMLLIPMARFDQSVFKSAREEIGRNIEDRISNHFGRSLELFYRRFFPNTIPVPEEDEKKIVNRVDFQKSEEAFRLILQSMTSVILYSGSAPIEALSDVANFAKAYSEKRDEQTIKILPVHTFGDCGEPIHEGGPADKTYFLRAIPFQGQPNQRETAALHIANQMFGGEFQSWLQQIIREKHHLAYRVRSDVHDHCNMILTRLDHDQKDYQRVISIMDGLLGKFHQDIDKNEFEIAQQQLLDEHIACCGESAASCDQPEWRVSCARQLYVKKSITMTPRESYRLISSLTQKEVLEAARKFINPEQTQIFTYGKNDPRG